MKRFLPLVFALVVPWCSSGQNIVANPSMELGTSSPTAWGASGASLWATIGRTGSRSLGLLPALNASATWYSSASIEQGKAYVFRFRSRATNAASGYCIGGFNTVSRDFQKPTDYWADYSMAAWVPSVAGPYFRFGFWNMDGTIFFDDAEVLPLNPVHKQVGVYRLGSGESLSAGHYIFQTDYAGYGANYSRPLYQANTAFNTSRWYMNPGSQLVYHHELSGLVFSNAQVSCGIYNYNSLFNTTLRVEASTNGAGWQFVGAMTANATNATMTIPTNLLPTADLFIRLSSTNSSQFGFTNYALSADVSDMVTVGVGETHYFGQIISNSVVQIVTADRTPAGKLVTLSIANAATNVQSFQITAQTSYAENTRQRSVSTQITAGGTNQVVILLPTAGFGDNTCVLTVQDGNGTNIFQQNITFNVNILTDDSFGESLPSPTNTPVWWCDGAYKVGRTRYLPIATNAVAHVFAARNEYEPFQIVLRPEISLSNVTAAIGDFVSTTNPSVAISATNVTVCRVEYVNVTQLIASEAFSTKGDHPDPLVPLTAAFDAPAQTNCPLWFTVHVPKDAAAGEYQADVTISSSAGTFTVPVRLKVFGFALTDVSHTRNAYGMSLQYAWHGLLNGVTSAQERAVWDLYLQNMSRHRVSPFFPQWYSQVNWSYTATNQSFTHDFTDFDAYMDRFLEEYNFTSFKDINVLRELPPISNIPSIIGSTVNPAYRPLYTKLMQPVVQHLRERGWLDRCYSFWLDEPQPPQFALFRDGMRMVQETAPDLPRLGAVFYGPDADLFGAIDVWVPQLHNLKTNSAHDRQLLGEQVWSYVAAGPAAPWPNNFIDHPGINPRVRSWVSESMGLTGEEYYAINYYLGTPNPWLNPMSSTDLNTPPVLNWGNGDGTLVYPPVKEKPLTPLIAGPFDSVRWEMTREGLEDREYFWSLARVLAVQEPLLGTNHPAIMEARAAKAAALGLVSFAPENIYPYDAAKLYASRLRLAAAIEALEDGAPFVAKPPLSKVTFVGASETLRIEAAGWPFPSIQWQHAGTNLPGATAAKLILTNLSFSMAGNYTVLLSNTVGTVTSAIGKLTVFDATSPPVLVAQPAGLTRTNAGRAVFGVGASSVTPLTYQWLLNGLPLTGATNPTLLVSNLTSLNSGNYSVLVSNAVGVTTSSSAPLYVLPPGGATAPAIVSQPTNSTVALGQNAQFAATATGTGPLNYQWSLNGTNLPSGGNGSGLTLTNAQLSQAGNYQVVVTNVAGAVTSVVATLTVQILSLVITGQPTNQTVMAGQSTLFAVTASGTDPLSYQWYFNDTNLLAGANSSALSLTNVQSPLIGNYTVLITNLAGAATSTPAFLQIYTLPNYTNEPPGLAGAWLGSDFVLTLAPDNRPRTVLVSTNLLNWDFFYAAVPSAVPVFVPTGATNVPSRFFRLLVTP